MPLPVQMLALAIARSEEAAALHRQRTCELIDGADANHWGDECPVAAQRLKDRQCTLCGSPDQWKKVCPRYEADKHKARNPTTTYWPTGPKRSAI